jgi:hypothetical protein
MIVILLSSIVVTNLYENSLPFSEGFEGDEKEEDEEEEDDGWRTTSPTAVK